MTIRKNNYVVLTQEAFERRISGMRNKVNKFLVNKGSSKANGYVQICTSPHMIFVEVKEIAEVIK